MRTATVSFIIDPFYAAHVKEKFSGIEYVDEVKKLKEKKLSINISGRLVMLQAHYWPEVRNRLKGLGTIMLIGKFTQFYTWIEAASRYPAAYCTSFDTLQFIDHSTASLVKGKHYLSKQIILWLEKTNKAKQEYLLKTELYK